MIFSPFTDRLHIKENGKFTLSKPRALARGASNGFTSAKDLAQLMDISYATINNYTDMGLLEVVVKDRRVRMYDLEKAKVRLTQVVKLISEGYTLRVIRKLLS